MGEKVTRQKKNGAPYFTERVVTTVTVETKKSFDEYCLKNSMKPSDVARQALRFFLAYAGKV